MKVLQLHNEKWIKENMIWRSRSRQGSKIYRQCLSGMLHAIKMRRKIRKINTIRENKCVGRLTSNACAGRNKHNKAR